MREFLPIEVPARLPSRTLGRRGISINVLLLYMPWLNLLQQFLGASFGVSRKG